MPTNNMSSNSSEEESVLRRGPWTFEEDYAYSLHVSLVMEKAAGIWLRRTEKSCRLGCLNYLKPDINLSPQEQLLILELHSKWSNRWSKIAAHLPGKTDNEIKNYWRTRVQKQARQLKTESNGKKFLEALQRFWMPRLLQKIEQTSSQSQSQSSSSFSSMKSQNSESSSILTNAAPVAVSSAQPIKEVKGSNKLSGKTSSSICSTDSMSILDHQPEYSGYNNPLRNDCYHVDVYYVYSSLRTNSK